MFASPLAPLESSISSLLRVSARHEILRTADEIVIREANTVGGDPPPPTTLPIEDSTGWKVYDHCAVVMRLYALYECFVGELLTLWLAELPQLFPKYSELPVELRTKHRMGVAHLLNRVGSGLYAHLSELAIVEGLHSGSMGDREYTLLSDSFLTETRNYTWDVLITICRDAGMGDLGQLIQKDRELNDFMRSTFRGTSTVSSELNNLVTRRNTAAHDEVTDILSHGELERTAFFVRELCRSLTRCATHAYVVMARTRNAARFLGNVIHRFREHVVGVQSQAVEWRCGMRISTMHNGLYVLTHVETIETNHVRHESYTATEGENVGLKLDVPISSRGRIYDVDAPIIAGIMYSI